jgi:hypothetical protein
MRLSDEEILDRARKTYGSEDVDVLSTTIDRVDDGAWVAALVWVPLENAAGEGYIAGPHDFSDHSDGLTWCDTEDVPSDFCSDEERCANGCICNVGDPDLRDREYSTVAVNFEVGLETGRIKPSAVMAMALHSARHAQQVAGE